jgi:hypothetical protein
MMWKGSYGYYVINEFPWVMNCYKGTPHESFNKTAGDGGGNQGGMTPPGGPPPGP